MSREKMYCVSIHKGQTMWLIDSAVKLANLREELDSYYLEYEIKEIRDDRVRSAREFSEST
jgi:hypothetical protein